MTDTSETGRQHRIQQLALENQHLHESLAQAQRLGGKYSKALTRLKQARQELLASERRMKGVLDSAVDCIINMDEQGRIIEFNLAAEKMFGYARAEVLGKVLAEVIIPPALREQHQQGLRRRLEGGAVKWLNKRVETIAMRADGSQFPVELSITEVQQPGSLLFAGFIRDLTRSKQAESELALSEKNYKTMVDEMPTAIGIHQQGRWVYVNPAGMRIMGASSSDEIIGRRVLDFVPEEDHVLARKLDQQQLGLLHAETSVQCRGCTLCGEILDMEVNISFISYLGKAAVATIFRDITQSKRAAALLQQQARDAESDRRAMLFMLEDLNESSAGVEQAKREWEQTFDAVTDPIVVHDEQGNIVRANKAYAGYAGLCFKEFIGKPYWQVFPRRDTPLSDAQAGRETVEEIHTDDGEFFLVCSYAISAARGGRLFIRLLENTTERRALMEMRKRFEFIADASADFMTLINRHYHYEAANRAFQQARNKSHEAIIGMSVGQIWGRELFESEIRGYLDACFGGEVVHYETALAVHGKEMCEYEISMYPYRDHSGEITAAVVISHEITDRKQAERVIIESRQQLQKSLEGTIQAIAAAEEVRDPYTAGHQYRVAELACAIAQEMGLPPQQILGIRMGGKIHDIGKINLPAEILSKPTRLSELEFSMIKGHSQIGYDILKDIDFPWPVADIVRQHHERVDGSGYPQGLKAEEICLEARIVAVADVVEAMSNHRPYRAGLGIDKALDEIKRGSGSLYDGEVASACQRLFCEHGYTIATIS